MDIIAKQIKDLKDDVPRLRELSDEYVFSLVCYKYFYNNGEFSYGDYRESFVDGRDDGGMDVVTIVEDPYDQVSLVCIQGKYIENLANTQDIIDMITKMHLTLIKFQSHQESGYNKRLKRILTEKLSQLEEQASTIHLVVFTSADISPDRREKIDKALKAKKELEDFQIEFYDRKQIEKQIEGVLNPKPFVKEAKLVFAKDDGVLQYGSNGIIVNVSANSIKELYNVYKDQGLFEQNFRYFVRNTKIDNNIKGSLDAKRKEFWFLNNGIIIGCKDYAIDGKEIKLFDFSIINGCQTTTLIGEYRGKHEGEDFVLPCKIVKPLKSADEEFFVFVSGIAESSNSQKPISDKDLKANRPEQKRLQQLLMNHEPKVFLEVKRGEAFKKKGHDKWQFIKNDKLGQCILSFNLQRPGTARGAKNKIFSEATTYSKVFHRKFDADTIVDCLKLMEFYREFVDRYDGFTDSDEESVATNGALIILAIIGFLVKNKRNKLNLTKIKDDEKWAAEVQDDNVSGKIFSDYSGSDFHDKLKSLFIDIINEIKDLYKNRENEEKTVSNFFKSDTKYVDIMLKHLVTRYIKTPSRKKEIDKYMEIFQ